MRTASRPALPWTVTMLLMRPSGIAARVEVRPSKRPQVPGRSVQPADHEEVGEEAAVAVRIRLSVGRDVNGHHIENSCGIARADHSPFAPFAAHDVNPHD